MKKTTYIAKAVSDNSIIFKGKDVVSLERQIKNFLDNNRKCFENFMGETVIEKAEYPYNVLIKEKGMWDNVRYVVRYKVKTKDGRTHNGSLLYTLRPIKPIEEAYFEKKIAIANAQYQARLALEKYEKKYGRR